MSAEVQDQHMAPSTCGHTRPRQSTDWSHPYTFCQEIVAMSLAMTVPKTCP